VTMAFLFFAGMTPCLIIHKKHLSVQDKPHLPNFVVRCMDMAFRLLS